MKDKEQFTIGKEVRLLNGITVAAGVARKPDGASLVLAVLRLELQGPPGLAPESLTVAVPAQRLEALASHLLDQARTIQANLTPRGSTQ